MGLLAPINDHLTALMRPSVPGHRRASMLSWLGGGLVALAAVLIAFMSPGVDSVAGLGPGAAILAAW